MTWLNAPSGRKQDRLPVRAAEHNVILPSGDGKEEPSQTCTVITTLLDHEAAPADHVRDTYLTRWSASETTFGEDKATITGAGNRTSGPVLRSSSPRLVIQEAWAWLTATQLVRASKAAVLRTEAAAARALRRRNQQEVTADEESFTAALRHAIRSMTSTQVTASSPLHALAAAADAATRAALHTLNVPGRQRHSPRAQKARPKFPTPPRPRRPSPESPRSPYSRPASLSRGNTVAPGRKKEPPRLRGAADRGTARHPRRDTRASAMPAYYPETDFKTRTGHQANNTPGSTKHLKYVALG
jgi:hypothetical protein